MRTIGGPQTSAPIYTLIETAQTKGLAPYQRLHDLLRYLPTPTTAEHLEALPCSAIAKPLI